MIRPFRLVLAVALLAAAGCQIETSPPGAAGPPDSLAAPRDTARANTNATQTARTRRTARPDTTTPTRPAPDPDSLREAARDAFEAAVATADTGDGRAVARAVTAASAQARRLAAPPDSLAAFVQAARAAAQRGDRPALALAAARAHQTLSAASPPGSPARVASLALVLDAHARAALPDWQAIATAADALAQAWADWSGPALAVGTRDAMARAVAGVESGAQTQNAPLVRLGAAVVQGLADTGR
ncbi:hypothetical protein [Rubrivirga sp. IMCC45206]|uniref:hypothetical protein n=1 Tax=Rubrivirga sp. IMCC45206 TaxID=3391614 RepID=UPI00398FFB16